MKKNKGIQKVNLIISVLIAVSTWLYVMYTVDPSMSKTYHDIPVRIVNAKTLGVVFNGAKEANGNGTYKKYYKRYYNRYNKSYENNDRRVQDPRANNQ
jgi:hypothetical protein